MLFTSGLFKTEAVNVSAPFQSRSSEIIIVFLFCSVVALYVPFCVLRFAFAPWCFTFQSFLRAFVSFAWRVFASTRTTSSTSSAPPFWIWVCIFLFLLLVIMFLPLCALLFCHALRSLILFVRLGGAAHSRFCITLACAPFEHASESFFQFHSTPADSQHAWKWAFGSP